MSLTGNIAQDYQKLAFATQLAHTPGLTAEQKRERGVKYAAQLSVRTAKMTKIAAALLGEQGK